MNLTLNLSPPSEYTDMSMSVVPQRQSIHWQGSIASLRMLLDRRERFRVFDCVDVSFDGKIVIMEWQATPVNDMYADTVLASLLQSELSGSMVKGATASKPDRMHFKECLIETLQDMFGANSVPKLFKGDSLSVTVHGKQVDINLTTLEVTCDQDEGLYQTVKTTVNKLHQNLVQVS
ncbi:hypothetical protein quinque_014932 [Culex quinquefasciatus]